MNSITQVKNRIEELHKLREVKYDTKNSMELTTLELALSWLSKFPKRYQKYTFSNLEETPGNKEAIEAVKNINIEDGEFILLYGDSGNGKTHLAVAGVINAKLKKENIQNLSIGYVELSEYFRQQRARMNGEKIEIPKYADFDLLVIDDLGKLKPTDWAYQEMFNLLERRWSNERATIITTNFNLEELPEKLSPVGGTPDLAMMSRITSGKVFEIRGRDRRNAN